MVSRDIWYIGRKVVVALLHLFMLRLWPSTIAYALPLEAGVSAYILDFSLHLEDENGTIRTHIILDKLVHFRHELRSLTKQYDECFVHGWTRNFVSSYNIIHILPSNQQFLGNLPMQGIFRSKTGAGFDCGVQTTAYIVATST